MNFDARSDFLRVETKGAFVAAEFMKLETLDETLTRIKAEEFSNA